MLPVTPKLSRHEGMVQLFSVAADPCVPSLFSFSRLFVEELACWPHQVFPINWSFAQRFTFLWYQLLHKSNHFATAMKFADVFVLLVCFAARQLGRRR